MKFLCPNCKKKYRINDNQLPAGGAQLTCKNCNTRFWVPKSGPKGSGAAQNPPTADIPVALAVDEAAAAGTSGTETPTAEQKDSEPQSPDTETVDAQLSPEQQQLNQLIAQNDTQAAAELLLELIKAAIANRDFPQAESWRDKLYEVAPDALGETVIANELIEEGRGQAIDQKHLGVFRTLYNRLDPEETNALYFALKPVTVKALEPVYRQGEFVSNLYLVQDGRLKLVYNDPRSEKEIFLKELYPGDVANVEPFLSFTGNTVTMVAQSDATLMVLEKAVLTEWKDTLPTLETKLADYCQPQENIRALVQKAGLNIRAHSRLQTNLKTMVQLLGPDGRPSRPPFSVNLHDISMGGLCYETRMDRKEEAAKMLGTRLHMQADYITPHGKQTMQRKGKIVAVRLQPFGASTIHIQFDRLLDKSTIFDISQLDPSPEAP